MPYILASCRRELLLPAAILSLSAATPAGAEIVEGEIGAVDLRVHQVQHGGSHCQVFVRAKSKHVRELCLYEVNAKYRTGSLLGEPVFNASVMWRPERMVRLHDGRELRVPASGRLAGVFDRLEVYNLEIESNVAMKGAGKQHLGRFKVNVGALARAGEWSFNTPYSPAWDKAFLNGNSLCPPHGGDTYRTAADARAIVRKGALLQQLSVCRVEFSPSSLFALNAALDETCEGHAAASANRRECEEKVAKKPKTDPFAQVAARLPAFSGTGGTGSKSSGGGNQTARKPEPAAKVPGEAGKASSKKALKFLIGRSSFAAAKPGIRHILHRPGGGAYLVSRRVVRKISANGKLEWERDVASYLGSTGADASFGFNAVLLGDDVVGYFGSGGIHEPKPDSVWTFVRIAADGTIRNGRKVSAKNLAKALLVELDTLSFGMLRRADSQKLPLEFVRIDGSGEKLEVLAAEGSGDFPGFGGFDFDGLYTRAPFRGDAVRSASGTLLVAVGKRQGSGQSWNYPVCDLVAFSSSLAEQGCSLAGKGVDRTMLRGPDAHRLFALDNGNYLALMEFELKGAWGDHRVRQLVLLDSSAQVVSRYPSKLSSRVITRKPGGIPAEPGLPRMPVPLSSGRYAVATMPPLGYEESKASWRLKSRIVFFSAEGKPLWRRPVQGVKALLPLTEGAFAAVHADGKRHALTVFGPGGSVLAAHDLNRATGLSGALSKGWWTAAGDGSVMWIGRANGSKSEFTILKLNPRAPSNGSLSVSGGAQ